VLEASSQTKAGPELLNDALRPPATAATPVATGLQQQSQDGEKAI
jgi:hypothetical protein